MQKKNLNELIEYDDRTFLPKVLVNEPGYRMVLLSIRAKQAIPEHANQAIVTVHAIRGHVTFYEGSESCELRAGEMVRIPAGAPHHIEAHEDSALLVLATGGAAPSQDNDEAIDVREIPRPQRHPLVFRKFDALPVGGSVRLINDHDPVPLGMQIEMMRPGQASWEYIQRGPDIFHIRIRRIGPPDPQQETLEAPPETVLTGINRA